MNNERTGICVRYIHINGVNANAVKLVCVLYM